MSPSVAPKLSALKALAERMASKMPSGEGHAAWRSIYGQVSHLAESAEALRNLHVTRNPTETEGAHIKRVATAAAKFEKEVDTALVRANKILHGGLADIEARVKAKARLAPDAYASEVRAAWRLLTPEEKTKTLTELIEQGRGSEVAAIVKAPTLLTGMSELHRKQYEAAFIAKHAPDELAEEEALIAAFDTALVSTRTAGEVARAYSDPGALAEITRAESAAAAAAKKFDATVSGS